MLKIIITIICCLFLIVTFGCASQIRPFNEYVIGWIGQPVDELIEAMQRPGSYASRTGWIDRRYVLTNKNWVYVSPENMGCIVHWEIDVKGFIVGYMVEGDCR